MAGWCAGTGGRFAVGKRRVGGSVGGPAVGSTVSSEPDGGFPPLKLPLPFAGMAAVSTAVSSRFRVALVGLGTVDVTVGLNCVTPIVGGAASTLDVDGLSAVAEPLSSVAWTLHANECVTSAAVA